MPLALVTGAGGFTGFHLLQLLERRGWATVGAVRSSANPPATRLIKLDVTFAEAVMQAVETVAPDVVFHLAGVMRGTPTEMDAVNYQAAVNVLSACRRHNIGLLLVGSAAEYGPQLDPHEPFSETSSCSPTTAYGRSKLRATTTALAAAEDGARVLVVRPFNLLGAGVPPVTVVGRFLEQARSVINSQDPTITMGSLKAYRDFLAVQDAVRAYEELVRAGSWGRVVNVCSGRAVSIRHVIERLTDMSPVLLKVTENPDLHPGGPDIAFGSPELLKELIGFSESVTLEESLYQTWEAAMEGNSYGTERG